MECMTIRQGYFRGFNCGRENGDFGTADKCARPWDSNSNRK
jgi:hypothetical protein